MVASARPRRLRQPFASSDFGVGAPNFNTNTVVRNFNVDNWARDRAKSWFG